MYQRHNVKVLHRVMTHSYDSDDTHYYCYEVLKGNDCLEHDNVLCRYYVVTYLILTQILWILAFLTLQKYCFVFRHSANMEFMKQKHAMSRHRHLKYYSFSSPFS